MTPQELKRAEVQYPESDGKPMAETDTHRELMVEAIAAVREHLESDPDFYVSGNLFVYYEEGDPSKVVSPDFFTVRGVPRRARRVYKVWEEGRPPEVVLELTSPTTHREDLGNKRSIYEDLGVKEYFIFDPFGSRSRPQLRAFRLRDGVLQPVPEARREGGMQVFTSEVLGLELHGEGESLRWVDPKNGKPLPVREELRRLVHEEEGRAEEERARADREKTRADQEKTRADQEKARAEAAEAELVRLRAELARLRKERGA